jgi:long-chain fatty acid transport protein
MKFPIAARHIARVALAGSAVLIMANAAHSAGFSIRSQSAVGNGMAHAGMGTCAWGASSMFWNPAAITCVPGRQSEFNLSVVMPQSEAITTLGTTNDISQDSLVPAGHNTWQLNDRLWIGLSTGAPFGANTNIDVPTALIGANQNTVVKALAATPTVGFKVNDWLSLGAGLTIQHLDLTLGSIAPGIGPLTISGDAFGVGFTAGVIVTPWEGGKIGLGYRSAISHTLEGDFDPTASPDNFPIEAKVTLPESLSLGIRQDINEQWSVMASAQWTNWSRVDTVALVGAPGTPLLNFNYNDEYMASIGAEYRYNQQWTFRAGAGYEWSPIDDSNRTLRVLDNDRIWLSAGVGYKFSNKLSGDLSYSHLFFKDADVVRTGLPGTVVGRSEASADVISLAVRYRWDAPAEDETVIRKY